MKSIENWKFANRLSAIIMMSISVINCSGFYVASLFMDEMNKYIFVIILIVEFAIMVYVTEKKISQNEKK